MDERKKNRKRWMRIRDRQIEKLTQKHIFFLLSLSLSILLSISVRIKQTLDSVSHEFKLLDGQFIVLFNTAHENHCQYGRLYKVKFSVDKSSSCNFMKLFLCGYPYEINNNRWNGLWKSIFGIEFDQEFCVSMIQYLQEFVLKLLEENELQ